MAMLRVMEKTWSRNILFSVLVELTYRCNLDCFFCYNDLSLKGRPLSDEQYFTFFQHLAELQVMNLTFTGGEPLAHPSFLRLGAKASELGFVVRIKSNGHAFSGELARQIRDQVDPFLIEVSLHGADAETHERQTRIPGSFDRLLTNLGEMRKLGFRVKLNGTLTRWNENQIEDMFALADHLGCVFSLSPTVTPRDDGDTSPMSIAPSEDGVRRLYRFLDERVPDEDMSPVPGTCTGTPGTPGTPGMKKNCGAGASGLAVDPFGAVYPCVQWRRPLGNLHDQSIHEIWTGSKDLDEIRAVNSAARRQIDDLGEEGQGVAHCMGLSEEKTGDPLSLDPEAMRQGEILRQVRRERGGLPIVS